MKKCSKCKLDKEFIAFASNKSKSSGLDQYCKECRSIYNRRNGHSYQTDYLRFNLTGCDKETYENLVKESNNTCYICGKEQKRQLSVDHCHKTGLIRGLLCGKCNMGLGLFNDDLELMQKAITYILTYRPDSQ